VRSPRAGSESGIRHMPTPSMPAFTPRPLDPRMADLLTGYPPELFTEKLHCSIELIHRYTLELAIDLLDRLGVTPKIGTWHTVDELCRLLSFDLRFVSALSWLLDQAVELGCLETKGDAKEDIARREYRLLRTLWTPELATLRGIGLGIDPANAATLDLLDRAASIYPAVARGEAAELALFDPQNIGLWLAYFHNDNPAYAVNNWIAAVAATERMADWPALRILEVGAGAGSGSEILLRVLGERGLATRLERYLITEPSAFFRRRAQRELGRRYGGLPLEFRPLDIDSPWGPQGAPEGEFDLVYGVNVLHVAHDLAYSLGEARTALAGNGWLVIGECLHRDKPIFPELIFQLLDSFKDVQTDLEFRPAPGFLAPDQWRRALARGGFPRQELAPDVERVCEICPNFLAGAVCGQKESGQK
jgi:SAM-dependent methyltransferase